MELEIDANDICVLGCDGTTNNTGWKEGSVFHIEQHLGKPCQRVVCLIHHCDLPFQKLFEMLDGQITAPNNFSGPIGKMAATNAWEESPVEFKPLHISDFPVLLLEVV